MPRCWRRRGGRRRLDDFRLQEGATLIADLLRRVDKIEGYKEEVVPYERLRTETDKARILRESGAALTSRSIRTGWNRR